MNINYLSFKLNKRILFCCMIALFANALYASADEKENNSSTLPLFKHEGLKFEGAFRLPLTESGDSRIAYSEGTFTLSDDAKSFFVVGHAHHQAIAEMSVPKIIKSKNLDKLKMLLFLK